jgi:hypothetical protein
MATLHGGLATSTASHSTAKYSDILDRNESTSSAHRDQDNHYCTLHHRSNLPAPWILCTLTATQTKRTPCNTSSHPPPPKAQTIGLQLQRLQEGHNADALLSHVQMDKVFTLGAPRDESTMPHHDVPNGEPDTPRVPPSCPPSASEDFRPKAPRLPPSHGHGSSPLPVSSITLPLEEVGCILKHHLSAATSTHQLLCPPPPP